LSQKHEGWVALADRYDDGGFSGGTIERPALKKILKDVQSGEVDTVVVYKVDRLTRSLTDFAKIIEVFDSHKVSFVSVTQQFNTTSSMGRLTLNVLLSFAQFEREITGERIRDKIAASKKKGMWMGGNVPLGYDCVNRQLVVNQVEAATVRIIFRNYLRLGCVSKLRTFLHRKQILSKVRTSATGRRYGGASYSRGALYHLLRNRIYLGEIVHKNQHFSGQHQAIISSDLWNRVAAHLDTNDKGNRCKGSKSIQSLLAGKLFDPSGVRFTPTHSVKNGKRYRYYTSQCAIQHIGRRPAIARLPALELEEFVIGQVHLLLKAPQKITTRLKLGPELDIIAKRARTLTESWPRIAISEQYGLVRKILTRVTLGDATVWTDINKENLLRSLLGHRGETPSSSLKQKPNIIRLTGQFHTLRRGREIRVINPDRDSCLRRRPVTSLVKAVARAHGWYERITSGKVGTVGQLAQEVGLTQRYVRKVLQFATLSPRVTEALLTGNQRPNLTLKEMLRGVPLRWQDQEKRFFLQT
jgi:DNA invertase Pin-like site-specific DNA recombinase